MPNASSSASQLAPDASSARTTGPMTAARIIGKLPLSVTFFMLSVSSQVFAGVLQCSSSWRTLSFIWRDKQARKYYWVPTICHRLSVRHVSRSLARSPVQHTPYGNLMNTNATKTAHAPVHPLDPLSPDEMQLACDLVKRSEEHTS